MLLSQLVDNTVDTIVYLEKNYLREEKFSISFNNTLSQVLITLSPIIYKENAKINSDFSELQIAKCAPTYLECILLNLISGSIKRKHPDRHPVINITTYIENSNPILEISDNGIGLEKGFEKLNKAKTLDFQGNTAIENVVNEGTQFKIYL